MNTVLTPRRRRPASFGGVAIVLIGIAVSVAVGLPLVRFGAGERSTLRRLTVLNPTPYIVNVHVSGAARDGWLDLGAVPREGRRTVEELADQGRRWVFRFSYGGVEAGELTLSRAQLASDGWTMTVPAEVAERLRAAGLLESAR